MFCKNCGKELPEGTRFCTSCGAPTIATEAQQTQQAPPIQPAQPVTNQSYQMPMMPPKKKFPVWAIVLIVIGAIIGVAALGIYATVSYNNNISSAKQLIQNGDYDAAKKIIEEELEVNDDRAELHILLADCYLGQDKYKDALSVLEAAKEDVDDTQEIEAKINEIKQTYSAQIEAEKKAEEEAKRKAEEEAKKKAEEEAKKEADRINSIRNSIRILGVYISEPNSADGVSLTINWKNNMDKTIKYIYFTVTAYNAVDDQAPCEIRRTAEFTGKLTGPFKKGQGNLDGEYYFDCAWYNNTIKYVGFNSIKIDYMDGTSIVVQDDDLSYMLKQ